jgi:hypothetical protein
MRFESRRVQNEKKMKKTHFAICKNVFFGYPLALHFKDDL